MATNALLGIIRPQLVVGSYLRTSSKPRVTKIVWWSANRNRNQHLELAHVLHGPHVHLPNLLRTHDPLRPHGVLRAIHSKQEVREDSMMNKRVVKRKIPIELDMKIREFQNDLRNQMGIEVSLINSGRAIAKMSNKDVKLLKVVTYMRKNKRDRVSFEI